MIINTVLYSKCFKVFSTAKIEKTLLKIFIDEIIKCTQGSNANSGRING